MQEIILSTLIISLCNFIPPFIKKDKLCNQLLIIISLLFLAEVISVDIKFLQNEISIYNIFHFDFGIFKLKLHIEPLGLVLLNIVGFLWPISIIYSIGYLQALNHQDSFKRFILSINTSIVSTIFVALSGNMFTMFCFYELLTIVTIPLVYFHKSEESFAGVRHYLKTLVFASTAIFLPAILIINAFAHTTNFISTDGVMEHVDDAIIIFTLLLCVFGIAKAAVFPFHRWIINAMVAPYPVSGLLHAVAVVKSGIFCLLKVIVYIFGIGKLSKILNINWIIYIPIFSIIYSSVKAVYQNNIKRILAFSTIIYLNIILMHGLTLSFNGIKSATYMFISHAISKIILFFSAGSIYVCIRDNNISSYKGIGYKMPITSLAFVLSSLSLIGIPPFFSGLINKYLIIQIACQQEYYSVLIAITISTIATVLYLSKVMFIIYDKKETKNLCIQQSNSYIKSSIILCLILLIMWNTIFSIFFIKYI